MSVTDLTCTRWYLNLTLDLSGLPEGSCSSEDDYFGLVIYTPDADEKSWIGIYKDNYGLWLVYPSGSSATGYYNGGILSNSYRYIEIYGGKDATNSIFIEWLEANAVQQEFESEEYLTNTYDLIQVANAIRKITKNYTFISYPNGMVSTLNNMGEVYTLDNICNRNIAGVINGSQSRIGIGAFYCCQSLIEASFPNCTYINDLAFYSCIKLSTISFPSCTYIGNSAFYNCASLIAASFPKCTTINAEAFDRCSRLTTISFPTCTFIGISAFRQCTSLTTASFPSCTSIDGYAFYLCTKLTDISFPLFSGILSNGAFSSCHLLSNIYMPLVTGLSNYVFVNCSSLSKVNFSYVSIINGYVFRYCTSLSEVSLPALNNISGYGNFDKCYNLISLNLTGVSQVTLLSYSTTFTSTPIGGYSASAGQYGSIYVPASLYDTFTSATNWTYFSSRMVSV